MEIIRITGSSLKERVKQLKKEGFYDLEFFYDDDTPIRTLADGCLYSVENEFRVINRR